VDLKYLVVRTEVRRNVGLEAILHDCFPTEFCSGAAVCL
jgi:hypothetical protein